MGGHFTAKTLKYLAPEQIEPGTYALKGKVRNNVDFWALGVIFYELLMGDYPFPAHQEWNSELLTAILKSNLPSDLKKITGGLEQFLRACLERDASVRPQSVQDLRDLLSGKLVWSPTGVKKPAQPPEIKSPPVTCRTCQHRNPAGQVICQQCNSALFGPAFLKDFKSPKRPAIWTIAFFTLSFLTLNFFYFSHHEYLKKDSSEYLFKEIGKAIAGQSEADAASLDSQISFDLVDILVILGIFLFFGLIAFVFFAAWYNRVSRNLRALGSQGQRFSPGVFILLLSGFVISVILAIPRYGNPLNIVNFMGIILGLLLLVPPLFALQELWKGSSPSFLVEGQIWRKNSSSFLAFACWLLSVLLPVIILLPVIPSLLIGSSKEIWFYLTVGITNFYWLIGCLFILRINFRQLQKQRNWSYKWSQMRTRVP